MNVNQDKSGLIFSLCISGFVFLCLVIGIISSLNKEASLRSAIEARLASREASFDTMKKIIMQKAQLPAAAKKDLIDLLPEVIKGRSGGNVFKSVQENYPEFTLPLYKDLSNSIEAERHVFLREQKELFDVKREHDALLRSVFGGSVCAAFGRHPVDVKVVSSTEAKETMRTGTDDTTDLGLGPKEDF